MNSWIVAAVGFLVFIILMIPTFFTAYAISLAFDKICAVFEHLKGKDGKQR